MKSLNKALRGRWWSKRKKINQNKEFFLSLRVKNGNTVYAARVETVGTHSRECSSMAR